MPRGRVGVTVTRTERHRGCSLTLGSTGLLQSPQPSGKLVRFLTLCPHLLWRPDVPNSFRGLGSWTGLTVSVSALPAPQPLKAGTWLSSDPAPFWHLSQAGLCPLGTSQGLLATGAGGQQVSTTGASRGGLGTAASPLPPAQPVRPLLRGVWPARLFHGSGSGVSVPRLPRSLSISPARSTLGSPIPGRPACKG